MAPPVRTYGTTSVSSTAENDPLASLMAPPPVRIPSQNSYSLGPPGGPPVRRAAAAPPTNVWTPPVNIMKPNPPDNLQSIPEGTSNPSSFSSFPPQFQEDQSVPPPPPSSFSQQTPPPPSFNQPISSHPPPPLF